MKLGKFLKRVGGDGLVLQTKDGGRWMYDDTVIMCLPNYLSATGRVVTAPEWLEKLISDTKACNSCTEVVLRKTDISHDADAKAKDIVKVFGNLFKDVSEDLTEVFIHNADFGLIEKKDYTYSVQSVDAEDCECNVLCVTKTPISEDDAEIYGYILDVESRLGF